MLTVQIREVISSGVVSNEQTLQTIKTVWENYGYLLDPHTAVAVTLAMRWDLVAFN